MVEITVQGKKPNFFHYDLRCPITNGLGQWLLNPWINKKILLITFLEKLGDQLFYFDDINGNFANLKLPLKLLDLWVWLQAGLMETSNLAYRDTLRS